MNDVIDNEVGAVPGMKFCLNDIKKFTYGWIGILSTIFESCETILGIGDSILLIIALSIEWFISCSFFLIVDEESDDEMYMWDLFAMTSIIFGHFKFIKFV